MPALFSNYSSSRFFRWCAWKDSCNFTGKVFLNLKVYNETKLLVNWKIIWKIIIQVYTVPRFFPLKPLLMFCFCLNECRNRRSYHTRCLFYFLVIVIKMWNLHCQILMIVCALMYFAILFRSLGACYWDVRHVLLWISLINKIFDIQ